VSRKQQSVLLIIDSWNYADDDGGPIDGGLQELPSNHLLLLQLRVVVVSNKGVRHR
jgi:hypothetical protein